MKVDVEYLGARLRAPFVSASGSVGERALVLLRLEDSAGRVGFGEAAPLPDYDGVSVDDVRDALEGCRTTLARAARLAREELLAQCTELAVLPPAVAAIDLALWDLEGRRTGQPVWRLLGARAAAPVDGQLHDRRRRSCRRRRAGERGQGGRVSMRQGEGRDRRRRRPAGRGPGRARTRGGDPARRERRVVHRGGHRGAARARAGRDRAVRGAGPRPRPDASARGRDERADRARRDRVGDRSAPDARLPGGVPEDRRLRWHHRRRRRGPPGARGRLRGLPRLDPRRPARNRGRAARRGGGAPRPRRAGLATLALCSPAARIRCRRATVGSRCRRAPASATACSPGITPADSALM